MRSSNSPAIIQREGETHHTQRSMKPLHWIGSAWNHFFFARCATKNALLFMGYIRIFYGLLLLYDRLILGLDFDLFFTSGMIPCQQSFHDLAPVAYENHHIDSTVPKSLLCTLAANYLPSDSYYFYYLAWTFYYLGLIHIVLFILGVAPKFQLLGIHLNLLSFHFYTQLLWDGEDIMIKIWNFLFMFLPLHHATIYDWKKKKNIPLSKTEESWPMWPFRLFQLELCLIYAGAGYAKLGTTVWRSGNALYHVRRVLY